MCAWQEACTCYDKHTSIHAASHSMDTGARVRTSHVFQMWANWLQSSSSSRAGFVCSAPACSLCEGQGAALHSWNVFRFVWPKSLWESFKERSHTRTCWGMSITGCAHLHSWFRGFNVNPVNTEGYNLHPNSTHESKPFEGKLQLNPIMMTFFSSSQHVLALCRVSFTGGAETNLLSAYGKNSERTISSFVLHSCGVRKNDLPENAH